MAERPEATEEALIGGETGIDDHPITATPLQIKQKMIDEEYKLKEAASEGHEEGSSSAQLRGSTKDEIILVEDEPAINSCSS